MENSADLFSMREGLECRLTEATNIGEFQDEVDKYMTDCNVLKSLPETE